MDVHVPADVPEDMRSRYLENFRRATCGTGMLNLFACDQKIEHLNDDFYDGGEKIPRSSNDPLHLFSIGQAAHQAGTLGVLAGQLGLIARYADEFPQIPYLVKLNSKTNVVKTAQRDPVSLAMNNIDDVVSLIENGINVVGIGYTVYLGSEFEADMLTEAAHFVRQAHEIGLIAVTWMYPRGQSISNEKDPQLISGAAGVALCIGADFTKVNQPEAWKGMDRFESLKVSVEAAGRTGVICSGGSSKPVEEFFEDLWNQVNVAGCRGAATGRNIHQKSTEEGTRMVAACHSIICAGASVKDALKLYIGE